MAIVRYKSSRIKKWVSANSTFTPLPPFPSLPPPAIIHLTALTDIKDLNNFFLLEREKEEADNVVRIR